MALGRGDHDNSALLERGNVGLYRRVVPHPIIHRRTHHRGSIPGERGQTHHIVTKSICKPCQVICAGGSDHQYRRIIAGTDVLGSVAGADGMPDL